ncbi:MAG: hypothetical protein ACETWM_17295 [Candidatus Lokiarchaeia archaeon]
MVSRRFRLDEDVYEWDKPYKDLVSVKAESIRKKDLSELNDIELEKHWKEIFDSPETAQEFKEEDFKSLMLKPEEFDFSGDQEDKRKRTPGVSKVLTETFSSKLKILREAIKEIDREIEERIELGKSFRERIDAEIFRCQTHLKHIENYTVGYNPSIEFRRMGLERQILILTKELRSEELRAWEDLVSLMKEKRTFIMEYENLINTRKMIAR